MKFSIIIPTKNRYEDMINTLKSIFLQTVLPSEIIIVDQNRSSDLYSAVIALFEGPDGPSKGIIDLTYIHDPEITGLTQARNVAVQKNKSDIVLFLDDDVILEKDFNKCIFAVFRDNPDIYGVSGVATNSRRGLLGDILYKVFMKGDFLDQRYLINTDPKYHDSEYVEVSKLTGYSMAFRKEIFEEFRFDENFIEYSLLEDVDFSFRVSRKYKTVITPRARLVHVFSETGRADHRKTIEGILLALKYFYNKNVDKSMYNRLCFFWVLTGYLIYSILLLATTRSTAAFSGYLSGVRKVLFGGKSDFVKIDGREE